MRYKNYKNSRLMIGWVLLLLLYHSIAFGFQQDTINLNGKWSFKIDPYNVGVKEQWHIGLWAKSGCDSLDVPGNWDVRNEYASYAGKAWYMKTFVADENWREQHVRLVFESVYNEAQVWLNGIALGKNELGFLSFSFDLLNVLNYGGENVLVVMSDNTFKRGAMWNWGGIRRPVWLEVTDKNRLEYQHITAIPDLDKGNATIKINFGWHSYGGTTEGLKYRIDIVNESGVLKSIEGALSDTTSLKTATATLSLSENEVKLWHFDHPYLYTSRLVLLRNEKPIHELKDRFGIREITVDGTQLLLNGKPIRTVGFNLIPEDRTTGSTLPKWRIMEDVDLMKSMGANMARLSHQNLPKAFLDYLDEKGIMVVEEVALWGKDDMVDPAHPLPKEWLKRMIREKYNHPSIMGWCVGNEIGYFGMNPLVMEYVKGAIQMAKELDPTRLAVYVSNSAHAQQRDAAQYSDLIMLNRYSNWKHDVEKVHEYYPGKPLFLAEFGHKITDEDPNRGFIAVDSMLMGLSEKDYVVGASYWSFNDYRSAYSGTPPSGNRSWGVVNVFRQKKQSFHSFQKRYSPVRSFNLISENRLEIQPRSKNEFPSYKLKDYSIVWESFDTNGRVLDGGFQQLDPINQGDVPFSLMLSWKTNIAEVALLKASLVSSLGYTVDESIRYMSKPTPPKVIGTYADSRTVRVIVEKPSLPSPWKVRYSDGTQVKETPPTINDFVEITGLVSNKKYQLEVVAINEQGESEPYRVDSVQTHPSELPPVIWHVEPTSDGWFVGYATTEKDYAYQVRYRKADEDYATENTQQFTTKGVGKVASVKPGNYFFQIRRLMEWGYESEWSHEIPIQVGSLLRQVKVQSVHSDDKGNLMVSFHPVHKAEGYIVRLKNQKTGKQDVLSIHAVHVGYFKLPKMDNPEYMEVAMEAILPDTGIGI